MLRRAFGDKHKEVLSQEFYYQYKRFICTCQLRRVCDSLKYSTIISFFILIIDGSFSTKREIESFINDVDVSTKYYQKYRHEVDKLDL